MGFGSEVRTSIHLLRSEIEQTIQFVLDLGVRGVGAGGDEIEDQPCKAPIGYPAPHRTKLSEDAVYPLKVRELPLRVRLWGWSAHEGEPLSIHRSFMPLGSSWADDPYRNHRRRRVGRSRERWGT